MQAKTIQKYNKLPISKLIEKATLCFNKYIRLRDEHKTMRGFFQCISCGKIQDTRFMHAGHYLSAGHNGAVRFDERNVNGQCVRCNTFLHGNQAGYRMGLINKIGLEEVEAVEAKSKMQWFKWDRFTLVEIIETYKQKCKEVYNG